ncbi:Hypothetical_protein [Hexamita inflata]|uniref:Hypothetical_protein n=1 Tax=Hexamita inflata TaxID=28002 RepID=A0AA86P486_9EUKA|nr:Hypothetical protein HINF_LOCUS19146 [Hexamita inflata]
MSWGLNLGPSPRARELFLLGRLASLYSITNKRKYKNQSSSLKLLTIYKQLLKFFSCIIYLVSYLLLKCQYLNQCLQILFSVFIIVYVRLLYDEQVQPALPGTLFKCVIQCGLMQVCADELMNEVKKEEAQSGCRLAPRYL